MEDVGLIRRTGDYYFGIGGIVTFKNSDLRNVLPQIGTDKNINRANSSYCTKESSYRKNCIPIYAIGGIGFDAQQWQKLAQNCASGACIMSAYMQI